MRTIYHERWEKDRGNELLIDNYPLNENSWVIELGGYQGWWTNKIVSKYNPNILVVEPIKNFCSTIKNNFQNNPKVLVECNGISTVQRKAFLQLDGDGTSEYVNGGGQKIEIDCFPIEYYLQKYKIEKIDLIQINIEGEEYPLLDNWIESEILDKIKFLQVQFHFIGDYEKSMSKIKEGLEKRGFKNKWDYGIVFSSWENTNF